MSGPCFTVGETVDFIIGEPILGHKTGIRTRLYPGSGPSPVDHSVALFGINPELAGAHHGNKAGGWFSVEDGYKTPAGHIQIEGYYQVFSHDYDGAGQGFARRPFMATIHLDGAQKGKTTFAVSADVINWVSTDDPPNQREYARIDDLGPVYGARMRMSGDGYFAVEKGGYYAQRNSFGAFRKILFTDSDTLAPEDATNNTVVQSHTGSDINLLVEGWRRYEFKKDLFVVPVPINLPSYWASNMPAGSVGTEVFCYDGDSGGPCKAVHDGTSWRVVKLGAVVGS